MPRMVDLEEISIELATTLNWQKGDARIALNAFFEIIRKHLDQRHSIGFKVLGTFSVRDDEHGFPKVKFVPSHVLNLKLGVSPEMNKYGVVLDENKSMTAKMTGKCPDCGTDLESRSPPKCPQCGTKPFEPAEPKDTDGEQG